jgi:hypothetical protein
MDSPLVDDIDTEIDCRNYLFSECTIFFEKNQKSFLGEDSLFRFYTFLF